MPSLLVATNNSGKRIEIQTILEKLNIKLVSPVEIGLKLDVKEDGTTYEENAAKKAREFALASGLISLADDTGLEVAALGGAPGLYSARYAPQLNATDADRRAYLLKNLREHPRPWKARFICVIAIAIPNGELAYAQGVCTGEIIPNERGTNGFGYDPIFLLTQQGKTMAELSSIEKNQASHRAKALAAASPVLKKLFSTNNT